MAIEQFFVVWNPVHGLPRYRHGSHEEAKAEAVRLARLHPGQEFFVLVSTGRALARDPVEWEPADDIPF